MTDYDYVNDTHRLDDGTRVSGENVRSGRVKIPGMAPDGPIVERDQGKANGTRAEHLAWCKFRAHQYLDQGDVQGAFASMASDLNKHPETESHAGSELGLILLMTGHLSTVEQMRDHIDGYN